MEQYEKDLAYKYKKETEWEQYEKENIGWKCANDLCENPHEIEPGSDIFGEDVLCQCGCSVAPYDFKTERFV